LGRIKGITELFETALDLVDGTLKIVFLLGELVNFLACAVEFILLSVNEFLCFIVLLLDAVQLDADLADLLSIVLRSRIVVVGFKQRVHVNSTFGTIVNTTYKKNSVNFHSLD